MAIHLDRNNMLFGAGSPVGNVTPEYYGQVYIDTITNPRSIWFSTGQYTTNWVRISDASHKHSLGDISGIKEEVKKLVSQEGIDASLMALMSNSNTWEGRFNNFTGALLVNGHNVITENSSLDSLGDVKMEDKKAGSILGWNGSNYVPYEVKGAVPSDGGGLDFSVYVRKDSLVNDINSSVTDAPLAAAAGKRIMDAIKAKYSPIGHTHNEYATVGHKHTEYLPSNKNISFTHELNIEGDSNDNPLSMTNKHSRISFHNAKSPDGHSIISFSKIGGDDVKAIIGGNDGNTGKELTLDFEVLKLPTGGIELSENKKYLPMPPVRIASQGVNFVGGPSRVYGINAGNNSVVGVSQLAFQMPANSPGQGILFPKSFAGTTQPSDLGLYHHLRMIDGELRTDTALASQANYISLGGRRIFFSPTDPGKAAAVGDLWFAL